MGYVRVKHRCPLPTVLGHGDLWDCDECGRRWRSVAPGNPAYAGWRRVWFRATRKGEGLPTITRECSRGKHECTYEDCVCYCHVPSDASTGVVVPIDVCFASTGMACLCPKCKARA